MTVGEKIHYLRTKNKMTMDDLSRELGVQRSAINKYEKGIVVNLKRSTISSLCRVFNVSSSFFLDDNATLEDAHPPEDDQPKIRIVSGMMERMSEEQQDQVVNVLKAMFSNHPELLD